MFMKANHLLPIAAFCLMTASCNTGKQQAELTAGIQLANLDTTALPGTDLSSSTKNVGAVTTMSFISFV